jgi:hypothetical protein
VAKRVAISKTAEPTKAAAKTASRSAAAKPAKHTPSRGKSLLMQKISEAL